MFHLHALTLGELFELAFHGLKGGDEHAIRTTASLMDV
jgi:hypothetical protein